MLTRKEFEEIELELIAALTEAIYKAALQHPEGFKEWLFGPSERP